MLKQEELWTLGNGERIRVFSDPWVTQKPRYRAEADPETDHRTEPRVSELMREDDTWDEGKVRQTVTARDAELILSMPIPYDATEDKHI